MIFNRAALDLVGAMTDAEFAEFTRQARQSTTPTTTGRNPMTPTAARAQLVALTAQTRQIRLDLTAELEQIRDDRDISSELRLRRATEARDAAAEKLAAIRQQVNNALAVVESYTPPPVPDAALGRAAARLDTQLDAGISLHEAIRVAAASRDTAAIAAAREAAPGRIAIDQATGGKKYGIGGPEGNTPAQVLEQVTQAADLANAQALTGPEKVAATDALLGKAQGQLARLELDAAQLEAMNRSGGGLAHAVSMAAAQQELNRLAAQLA